MNIYWRELWAHLKSFLIWSGTMVFLILAGMMKYSAFQKTGAALNEAFANMPPAVMKVMGIEPGQDLTSIGVFYSIFFLYFLLLMTVHSAMLGVSVMAWEERDKTADFLFARPIRRSQAITAKLLAALTYVVAYNLVTFATSALIVAQYNTSGVPLTRPIFTLTSCLLVIQVLYLALGVLLGSLAPTADKASGLATALILGTFLLKVLIDLKEDLEVLTFLSPYRYFKAYDLMIGKSVTWFYIVVALSVSLAAIAFSYRRYQLRDLRG